MKSEKLNIYCFVKFEYYISNEVKNGIQNIFHGVEGKIWFKKVQNFNWQVPEKTYLTKMKKF